VLQRARRQPAPLASSNRPARLAPLARTGVGGGPCRPVDRAGLHDTPPRTPAGPVTTKGQGLSGRAPRTHDVPVAPALCAASDVRQRPPRAFRAARPKAQQWARTHRGVRSPTQRVDRTDVTDTPVIY